MKMWKNLCFAPALAACLTSFVRAAEHEEICREGGWLLPAPATDKPGRKYMRDRLAQVEHLKLDVTPDFATRSIRGTSTLTFKPIAKPLEKLELDAVGLTIDGVTAQGAVLKEHDVTDEKLVLVFDPPVAVEAEAGVTVTYHVTPEVGLYFRTPEMGYKEGDTQVWSQGEPELHRYWYPGYDYPNQRFTSEVICHVPEGMKVVSNGSLVSQEKGADGLVAWHWKQAQPHPNYLVALAAGYFYTVEDKLGALPLAVSVPPSEKDQAAIAFRDTKKIIDFYQKETGVPFAWDKYHQVYCLDFLAGGMENTSCTFDGAGLLFRDDDEQLKSMHYLDAHETAHQWFGDLVTCRDWSHVWLNEGFASYYAVLYEEQKNGLDSMRYELWREAKNVFESLDNKPIVWRDYTDPQLQFDYRAYPKGAWVLHMIRTRLGPALYRKCIQTYLERHRLGNVSTDDLQEVIEELSGLSFDQFFDQWVYHGGLPELKIEYSWDASAKQAKVTVKQTQKVSSEVLLYRLDLPLRFFVKEEENPRDFNVVLDKAEEDFNFSLPAAPELLRVDPEYTLLAKIDFQPPPEMLKRQLKSDVIGRMLAVQQMSKKKNAESVKLLDEALNGDAFHAVRSEAAKALKTMATPEARTALVHSTKQDDARVRLAVVEALAAFVQTDAQDALWKLAESEKNPLILGAVIKTWGARPGDPKVAGALRRQLASSSHHQTVASAAISALRAQDDATAVPAILERLKRDGLDFSSYMLAQAFDVLAFLARNDTDRNAPRDFLTGYLGHPRESLRVAAAKALGTLHDPKAIAVLEPLTQTIKLFKDPVREAAEKSVQALEAERTKKEELKDVWSKLQDLQKKTEEMQREIDKAGKRPGVSNASQEGSVKAARK
jgi:aminopeptidase N